MYEPICTEGMTHGKAMDFAMALNDGIGPRLTGSPQYEKGDRLDARHTHEDRPRERPPQRLGRLRHGLVSDQYVGPHNDARSRAYLDAPSAMVRSNKWLDER